MGQHWPPRETAKAVTSKESALKIRSDPIPIKFKSRRSHPRCEESEQWSPVWEGGGGWAGMRSWLLRTSDALVCDLGTVRWVCSLCENSSNCMLFCVYAICQYEVYKS